jgi:hypothetical protein
VKHACPVFAVSWFNSLIFLLGNHGKNGELTIELIWFGNHQYYWNSNCTGPRSNDGGTVNTNKCPDGSANDGSKCHGEMDVILRIMF